MIKSNPVLVWMHNIFLQRAAAGVCPQDWDNKVYRLSYLCGHCDTLHVEKGPLQEVLNVGSAVLVEGAKSVSIEDDAFAMELDLEEAEADAGLHGQPPST
jgi:hypothetical protein